MSYRGCVSFGSASQRYCGNDRSSTHIFQYREYFDPWAIHRIFICKPRNSVDSDYHDA